MDAFIHPNRDRLHDRRYALKNRERLNRLLMLMLLHANRQDEQRDYAKAIRELLEANHGRPRKTRRRRQARHLLTPLAHSLRAAT